MTRKLTSPFLILIITMVFINCKKQNTADALSLQNANKYSDEYYANLRAYKKSDHQVFYGWFAAYGNKEGVIADYKQSASFGEHIAGLPDSLDFCSLWAGIPSLRHDDSLSTYNPIAYTEMRRAMEVRGIKMVIPEIIRIQKYNGRFELSDQGLKDYANYLLGMVRNNDLDGLDLDYEPNNGQFVDWLSGNNLTKFVQILGDSVGPKSAHPDKYLIVDYYTDAIPSAIEPYINYLVNQSYTQGTTTTSASFLQGRYNSVSWLPTRKFIVTENLGDWWATGGSPFTEANGNTLTKEGTQMYSLEGMARWNPTQGKKAGWGGFYFDRDYNTSPPYRNVRRTIQIVNPAVR
ncbi:MAG: glycoside hydrolase family 18 [Bacteroidota bacterium]|nr:glycoside hydrolase family 18 [Bacteroidota bacterium]